MFVSLWGCELKYTAQLQITITQDVRFLAETWVEMVLTNFGEWSIMFVSLRRRELKFLSTWGGNGILCSSPCGDVSCNIESAFKEYLKEGVRPLAETWVEMENNLRSIIEWSGSSPCGDVSWKQPLTLDLLDDLGSSPCGDVSWNNDQAYLLIHELRRSSPYGDVSWNMKITIRKMLEERSSPYGDVNWNAKILDDLCANFSSSP